ncbi:MAG TPA: polysaccharide deacetylase family protein [Vicinamibacterales bacterium]|nr:polysaccharide deacetylase family protein [Vicinamibacterales bacterium]
MNGHGTHVPFNERGGPLRGLLDLAAGRYPAFLFGGPIDGFLPVFHFHGVTPEWLEPRLQYLADHGYRTVTSDAIARLAIDGVHPGPNRVALCFDDAWASLWTVAAPLLRRFGFTAIAYAIPERIGDAHTTRPTLDDGVADAGAADRSREPFVTWPELRRLHDAGTIDVQAHTWSHAMIFCADRLTGFVTPEYAASPLLARPLLSVDGRSRFQEVAELGAPLFVQRSRMSDGLRFLVHEPIRQRTIEHVASHGGAAFFERPGWKRELARLVSGQTRGRHETPEQRERAILDELDRCRAVLTERLGSAGIRHICLPWGVAGDVTRQALRATGYRTAFSNQMKGSWAVRAGDDPYRLKRLNSKYLFRLPRRSRNSSTGRA